MFSGRGLCDELITRPEESPTDCGASLCVFKNLVIRGSLSARWDAKPEMMVVMIMMMIMKIIITIIINFLIRRRDFHEINCDMKFVF
jgi:hypothetical protein